MKKQFLTLAVLMFMMALNAQDFWSLNGNSGTNWNFIGTTDGQPLRFKVNGNNAGRIDPNSSNISLGEYALDYFSGSGNIAIGHAAMAWSGDGHHNIAIGTYALKQGGGSGNIAIGHEVLHLSTKNDNIGIGFKTLHLNTIGEFNTAVGVRNLQYNTEGVHNTSLGYEALIVNTASLNTALGSKSLHANTIGDYNTSVGAQTMENNTTGKENAAFASGALYSNINGDQNTALGTSASWFNISGQQNVSVGHEALSGNREGSNNVAVGTRALWSVLNGGADGNETGTTYGYGNYTENTAVGYEAMRDNVSGDNNTSLGFRTLMYNKTGRDNIAIGSWANVSTDGINNSIAIGTGTTVTASNQVRIGNIRTTKIGGPVGWSVLSDGRAKKDVKNNVPGLEFINLLNPVTYHYDLNSIDQITRNGNDESSRNSHYAEDIAAKQKIQYTGFIAQEVEEAAKSINYDFSGVDVPQNDTDLYSIKYAEFVVPLVKSVQELSEQNEQLKDEVISLKNEVEELKDLIKEIINAKGSEDILSGGMNNPSKASLSQNIPNPYSQGTTIKYTLPDNFSKAMINIVDMSGKVIEQISLKSNAGQGEVNINAGMLNSSGIYFYSLIIDGKIIDTKKMIHS